MDNQEACAKELPPNPEKQVQGNVSAQPKPLRATLTSLFFLMVSVMIVIALIGSLPNNPVSREICCARLSMESILEKDDRWPPLPLWARYYIYALNYSRTAQDGHFFLEKAIDELRKYEGGDYWVARLLHDSARSENSLGHGKSSPQQLEAHLRESLVKFLATRGPRDPNASIYWWMLGAFYEEVPYDYRRAKQCYERSLVSAFISQQGGQTSHRSFIDGVEKHISGLHKLTGNNRASPLIDHEQDFGNEEVGLTDELRKLNVAEHNEDFLQMPGWPLPHRLYSDTTKCWGILHDSPKEIDALYQSVLKTKAEQIRSESPEGATIMNRYAGFLRRQGKTDEAAKFDKKVIEIRDRQPKPVYLPANWKQLADDTSVP